MLLGSRGFDTACTYLPVALNKKPSVLIVQSLEDIKAGTGKTSKVLSDLYLTWVCVVI